MKGLIPDKITLTVYNCYSIAEWEKKLITRCLYDNPSFTLSEIAEQLGINVRTLHSKIKEFKIDDSRDRRNEIMNKSIIYSKK